MLANRWQQCCTSTIRHKLTASLLRVFFPHIRGLSALCPRSDIGVHQWGPEQSSPQTPAVGSRKPQRRINVPRVKVWRSCRLCARLLQVTRNHQPQRGGAPQQGNGRRRRALLNAASEGSAALARPLWTSAPSAALLLFFNLVSEIVILRPPNQCMIFPAAGLCLCSSKAFCASYPQKHLVFLPLAETETFRHSGRGWRRLYQIQQRRLFAESECKQRSLCKCSS